MTVESVNTSLRGNKEGIDHTGARGPGYVLFVMFDAETERLAEQLGMTIALAPR